MVTAGGSPVLISSSPPTAGQHPALSTTVPESPGHSLCFSPSERPASPITLISPRSSGVSNTVQLLSPLRVAPYGVTPNASVLKEQGLTAVPKFSATTDNVPWAKACAADDVVNEKPNEPLPAAKSSPKRKAPSKTPRKRFAKSASIIINSDDPDDDVPAETLDNTTVARTGGWSSLAPCPIHECDQETQPRSCAIQEGKTHEDDSGGMINSVMRRRRSWTPARNTAAVSHSTPEGPEASLGLSVSPSSLDPQLALATFVSRFSHSGELPATASCPRSSGGAALTKRRRLETSEATNQTSVKAKQPKKAPPKPKKRRIKVIKGPQTITAIATSAYQPRLLPDLDEATITMPSVPSVPSVEHENSTATAIDPLAAVKPGKPRTKSSGRTSKARKVAETGAPKTSKSSKTLNQAPLLPPLEARAQEKKQEFLFGTSSQLAIEESPKFIQEIQRAIRNSEAALSSQAATTAQQQSRAKATTGSRGTLLSMGQSDKDLWCTAARDRNGCVLGLDQIRAHAEANDADRLDLPAASHKADEHELPKRDKTITVPAQEVVDLCQSSPMTGCVGLVSTHNQIDNGADMAEPLAAHRFADSSAHADAYHSDSWMLLKSDTPTPKSSSVPARSPAGLPSVLSETSRRPKSPSKTRVALQTLNVNISPGTNVSPFKLGKSQSRTLAAASAMPSSNSPSPLKQRGRPKAVSAAAVAATDVASLHKTRRHPPSPPVSAQRPRLVDANTSTPSTSSANNFKDIDEISDSDVPPTPSPPRRKATSTPVVQALDLRASDLAAEAPGLPDAVVVKPGSSHWAAIQQTLFPQISAAIRSAPRSNDMKNPTWHEKILLYDPIVLEDLTTWLNEQGVRFEVRRLKERPKSRGRKKKDAIPAVDEYETCAEPVKPWMVQKWCEEKSICCLWKEGLRGGVRTKY